MALLVGTPRCATLRARTAARRSAAAILDLALAFHGGVGWYTKLIMAELGRGGGANPRTAAAPPARQRARYGGLLDGLPAGGVPRRKSEIKTKHAASD